jgi:hypothetical protein
MKTKKGISKSAPKSKKSFERDYRMIVKEFSPVQQQWSGTGDGFAKFSLDKQEHTIALPYTSFNS